MSSTPACPTKYTRSAKCVLLFNWTYITSNNQLIRSFCITLTRIFHSPLVSLTLSTPVASNSLTITFCRLFYFNTAPCIVEYISHIFSFSERGTLWNKRHQGVPSIWIIDSLCYYSHLHYCHPCWIIDPNIQISHKNAMFILTISLILLKLHLLFSLIIT